MGALGDVRVHRSRDGALATVSLSWAEDKLPGRFYAAGGSLEALGAFIGSIGGQATAGHRHPDGRPRCELSLEQAERLFRWLNDRIGELEAA